MITSRLATFAALGGLLLAVQPAFSQQIGRDGYEFPARNPSLAAQFTFQQRAADRSAASSSSASGLGALNQFVTTYSSTSTSVGNMNTVTQILSEGSSGSLDLLTDQDSTGDQGSEATADIAIDNSIEGDQNITLLPDALAPEPDQEPETE